MKIAFDVDVIKDLGVTRMVHQVTEWGYKYIEQSPRPQVNPFYKHPCASREIMAEHKQALHDTGLRLSSFIHICRWSDPDELRCQVAVKNWKWLVEIAVEMGTQMVNTEFSDDLNQFEVCDEIFYRSMEELLPVFEREGIRAEIQAHPWGFCGESNETVDIVKSFHSDNVKYVYSVPHTFFYNRGVGDVASMLRYVGNDLSYVLIADTRNHMKHRRYIINPPSVGAVVHRHIGAGEGDVDSDALFRTLRGIKFAKQTFRVDGGPIVVALLFGYPEKMEYQAVETRELIKRELLRR